MTRHYTASLVLVFCASLLLPSVASAYALVFTNFGAGQSYDLTQGNIVGNDFAGDNLAEADTFTPSATATFGSLDIALSCLITTCPDPFKISLTLDSGSDSPGTVIESFTGSGAALGQLNVNHPPLVFNSVLLPTLTGGTQYWVTISTDLNNSFVWNLNTAGDTSDEALSPDGGSTWFVLGSTPGAYEVNSAPSAAIPEPGTFWLLAGALSAYLLPRFRLRQRG